MVFSVLLFECTFIRHLYITLGYLDKRGLEPWIKRSNMQVLSQHWTVQHLVASQRGRERVLASAKGNPCAFWPSLFVPIRLLLNGVIPWQRVMAGQQTGAGQGNEGVVTLPRPQHTASWKLRCSQYSRHPKVGTNLQCFSNVSFQRQVF